MKQFFPQRTKKHIQSKVLQVYLELFFACDHLETAAIQQ